MLGVSGFYHSARLTREMPPNSREMGMIADDNIAKVTVEAGKTWHNGLGMKSHSAHSVAVKRSQIWRQMVSESSWNVPPTFQLPLHFGFDPSAPRVQEKNGAVYTKPWVVELILDLAGYTPQANLVDAVAIEPAVGDGAFLVPMALRLVQSCQRQQRPATDIATSLRAYELDETSALAAKTAVVRALVTAGLSSADAAALADGWITTGDYLFDAPTLPSADFIIGNPPYIRLEDMDDQVAATYRSAYMTMIGRADIYVAFFEAALRQLKPNGVVAFICADRWMRNQYGAELRRLVTRSFSVETVVEMHKADAFALDVSAYPAITVIRRADQGPAVVASAVAAVDQVRGAELAKALTHIRLRQEDQCALLTDSPQPASRHGLLAPIRGHACRPVNWRS